MHSNLLQSVAAERIRDMRREAATQSLVRRDRFTRPSRRTDAAVSHGIGRLVRRTVHP
jgi:hypothetical protein